MAHGLRMGGQERRMGGQERARRWQDVVQACVALEAVRRLRGVAHRLRVGGQERHVCRPVDAGFS